MKILLRFKKLNFAKNLRTNDDLNFFSISFKTLEKSFSFILSEDKDIVLILLNSFLSSQLLFQYHLNLFSY